MFGATQKQFNWGQISKDEHLKHLGTGQLFCSSIGSHRSAHSRWHYRKIEQDLKYWWWELNVLTTKMAFFGYISHFV